MLGSPSYLAAESRVSLWSWIHVWLPDPGVGWIPGSGSGSILVSLSSILSCQIYISVHASSKSFPCCGPWFQILQPHLPAGSRFSGSGSFRSQIQWPENHFTHIARLNLDRSRNLNGDWILKVMLNLQTARLK